MTGRMLVIAALVVLMAALGALLGGGTHTVRRTPPRTSAQVIHGGAGPRVDAPLPSAPTARPIAAPSRPLGSPTATVRAYAMRYINWSWRDAGRQQRQLAALATGELGRILRATVRTSAWDARLRRDQPSSRGTVKALTVRGTAHHRVAIVVCREQTYSHEIADEGGLHWRVYTATLRRQRGGGWAMTSWQAQP